MDEASQQIAQCVDVEVRMQKTSPPRISRGAGFAFKLPVLDIHHDVLDKAQDKPGHNNLAEGLPDAASSKTFPSNGSERAAR